VNVFRSLSKERMYGPFFFMEATITGYRYHATLPVEVTWNHNYPK
jgi:hypothetical protein